MKALYSPFFLSSKKGGKATNGLRIVQITFFLKPMKSIIFTWLTFKREESVVLTAVLANRP